MESDEVEKTGGGYNGSGADIRRPANLSGLDASVQRFAIQTADVSAFYILSNSPVNLARCVNHSFDSSDCHSFSKIGW